MRWGVGTGASRLVSGTMTIHRRLEERLAAFKGREAALLFGSGYLANTGVVAALARPRRRGLLRRAQPRLDRRRLPALARRDVRLRPLRPRHLEWGLREAERPRRADRDRLVFSMDGDVAPLEGLVELARRYDCRLVVDEAHGPARSARAAAAPSPRPASGRRRRRGRHAWQGARRLRRLRRLRQELATYLVNTARPFIFSTAPPPPAVAAALAALELLLEQPRARREARANAAALRDELAREGFDVSGSTTQIVPLVVGDAERRCGSARRRSSAASSRRRSGRRRSRRAARACGSP